MRLVVTGGGTGGHIYPALAVVEALKADPKVESIHYIGKTGGLESELASQNGIPFKGIEFYGMPRGKTLALPVQILKWAFKLQRARAEARRLLMDIRPHVVFGTGGYVSAPILMAAKTLKIPYVVHEPDAQPGLVNRLMSKDARVITTSFSEGAAHLKRRADQEVLITGNPIRGDIGHVDKAAAMKALALDWSIERPVLLVTGGSQGARRINQAVVDALPTLINEFGLSVVHLTGKKLYDETLAALLQRDFSVEQNPAYRILPYATEMPALLGLSSLALCRAGSLSLSEMAVCGLPTVLIPYPFAASDHQRKNAQAAVRAGASVMLEDHACIAENLLNVLRPMVTNPEMMARMKAAALALGHPHATEDIIRCLKRFAP